MADKKITELNDATLPLDGTEQIAIVQGGETKKVSADELGGDDSLWEVSTGANSLIPKNSNSVASGDGAIAEGQNTVAQGNHSTAMGLGSIAIGDFSLAQGRSATAQGEGSVAQGEDTFATGKGSFSSGIESNANGDSSSAIGDNVTSNAFGETVVGAYNEVDTTFNPTVSVPEDKAFSVGVGSFGSEANGIVVRKNGIVTANSMTQALFDADTSGKIVVTKEILNNELPSGDFVEKSGDQMTGLLQAPAVQERSFKRSNTLTGIYNVDWSLCTNHDITMSENTTITQSNIVSVGFAETITIYVKGDFALTLPTEWIVIGGTYDTNGTQFIVQSWDDGNFYCAIGGGEIDLSNYLQKSGGTMSGALSINSDDVTALTMNKGITIDNTDYNSPKLFNAIGKWSSVYLSSSNNTIDENASGIWSFINTGSGSETRFYVQDANNVADRLTFDFRGDGGNAKIISGTSNGYVLLGSTPIFADNTSASSLEVGTIYRTSDGTLKIKY